MTVAEYGLSVWDLALDDIEPCIRCGARVAFYTHMGGPMEAEVKERRCRRCRHDQPPIKEDPNG